MWRPGDQVMGIVSGGAYAERVAVHERQLLAVPSALGLSDAAAIPEVFLTAWDALVVQGGLTSGRWALVHAGASGVGNGGDPGRQGHRRARRRHLLDGQGGGLPGARRRRRHRLHAARTSSRRSAPSPAGQGPDVILDVIGGDYVERNLQAIAVKGRIVQVGMMTGAATSVDVGPPAAQAGQPDRHRAAGPPDRGEDRAHSPLRGRGAAALRHRRPAPRDRLPLPAGSQIAEAAHRYMESNANVGKIVIDVDAV